MASNIHPTAIIDASAEVDGNVKIGAYSIIGKNVSIASGTVVHSHAHITSNSKLGKNNIVHTGAIIGELAQDVTVNQKFGFEDNSWVEIGDENTFFSYCLISRGAHGIATTKIGNHCLFLGRSHVGHDAVIGDHCILSHSVMVGGHVELGNYVHVGGGVAVHQHCKVGSYSMIGAMSLVLQDIFPFSLATGNPAIHYKINIIGLHRQNFSAERIEIIDKIFKKLRVDSQDNLEELENNADILYLKKWRENHSNRGIGSFKKIGKNY